MAAPSTQLIVALNELKAAPELGPYNNDAIEIAHNAGVLAQVEGFDELSEMLLGVEDDYDVEEALNAWPVDLKIHMTYETWDEEALEIGETDDAGFYEPGGWKYPIKGPDFQELVEKVGQQQALEDMTPEPEHFLRLDEAFDFVTSEGYLEGSGSPHGWYTTVDSDDDYATGERTNYSFHPEGDALSRLMLHRALQKAKAV